MIEYYSDKGTRMLHPALAHFAVVLPIVALAFSIAYLIKPSELMSKISARVMVFASIFIVAAFFTGKDDGSEVYALLTSQAQALLLEHKNLGLYLVIAMPLAAIVKFYGCMKKNFQAEIFSILLLTIITAGIIYQGNMGGDLTYKHGAHVTDHSDGMDCLEDPSEFLEEVEE